MEVRIDSKSVMPLGWVLGGMSVVISATIIGVFWVSTVNFRLQRIEEKLGIPPFKNVAAVLNSETLVTQKQ